MTQKIKLPSDEVELRYANWIKMVIDLIKPQNLYLIGGRGVAKSSDIIAERTLDIIYDMPRASFAFVSDTYVNLMTNIVPHVLTGWERKKFLEDHQYVVDKVPPDTWKKPYIKTFNYKHTISTFNGCKFFLKSLDRPSINAGISVVHQFGDEAKYLKEDKLNKLFPTLRGDSLLYGNSHFYLGHTFCTDMPDPASLSEDDWILRMEKKMNKQVIVKIIQCALVVNEINIQLYYARKENKPLKEIEQIEKKLQRWLLRLKKIRSGSSFFYVVSSFANADILTFQYFKVLLETLEFEEFKTSVLSFKRSLEKGMRFYGKLNDTHFYGDGYNYNFYDGYGLKDTIIQSCAGLRYLNPDIHLEAGFDSGNMMSMVIAQDQGSTYRIVKCFYTLTPEWISELAAKFIEFFKPHNKKILHLYYDRSANQYARAKQDLATKLKHAIEYKSDPSTGKSMVTGWHVLLMSKSQRNITHSEEYNLMNDWMGEGASKYPRLMIDMYECKELKSSLESAPVAKEKGVVVKVKKSEKFPLKRLPMESTNFSDAFKYLLCRPPFSDIAGVRNRIYIGDIKIRG